MALTQAQLATAVADRSQLSKTDAKRALAALDEVVLDELGNGAPANSQDLPSNVVR